jgi:DNA-binding Lrp family transcriptional regulator
MLIPAEFPGTAVPEMDDVDRAVLAALAGNGRASWGEIGAAAGCSASTAQRRYQRLHEAGYVKVIAASDVLASGFGLSVEVRVSCGAAGVAALADALTARDEVRFVATLTGSADIVAQLVVSDHRQLETLVQELFSEAGARSEALTTLRTFTVPFAALPGVRPAAAASTGGESAATPNAAIPDPRVDEGVAPLSASATPLERAVFENLIDDGRLPLVDLARAVGQSEGVVKRVLDALIASGRIRIGPLVAPALFGLNTELTVWISVAPDHLSEAARQLAAHPAVAYTAATAGRYNLVAQVFLRDVSATYDFTTAVLGALPGVREVDVAIQMTTRKRMWARLEEGRFAS